MPPKITSLFARLFCGPAGNVFRGMVTLALGAGVARIIGVASIPVLTRIYSPQDYGVLSVFTSLVLMLAPMLSLRYVVAIPLPSLDGMAMNLMALSASLMLGMVLLTSIILWFFGPALLGLISMEVLTPYCWLIVLGIVGTGSYELLSMWATRRKAYRAITRTQVLQSVVGSFLKIGLGLLALKPLGLLIGQVAVQSSGIGSLVVQFKSDFRRTAGMISLRRMGFVARYYYGFPLYQLPSQFLLIFSQQAPLIFLVILFDTATAGQFGLAFMAIKLPISFISYAIAKAYYAEVAHNKDLMNIKTISLIIVKRLLFIAIFPTLTLMLFGPELFVAFFGEKWRIAGQFSRYLSIFMGASMIAVIFYPILNRLNRHADYLTINLVRSGLVSATFLFGYQFSLSSHATVLLYCVVMLFFQTGNAFWYFFVLEKKIRNT